MSDVSAVAVITNPRARRNRRSPGRPAQLGRRIKGLGEVCAPDGFEALETALVEQQRRGVSLLIVDGGDGTLHRVLTSVAHVWGEQRWPRLAVLRSGTMNIVADSIGSRGQPDRALAKLVEALRSGIELPTTRRCALRVDGRYGFIFGNGIVARYLEVHYEGGGSLWNAARLLGAGALSAVYGGALARRLTRPWRGEVVVDGVSRGSRDWTAIAVGTVEQIGLGFTPFPDVAAHPSQLQIVEVGGGVPSLALELPNIFRGRHLTRPGNRTGLGRQVILRSEAPMTYMLDGDFYRGTSETTLACDRAVEFVVPP